MFREFRNIERAGARLQIKRDQSHQRDERADAQVKRDLERGVVLLFAAAPDADHDERRHQRQFVEKVEEEQVERRERAEDAARHDQQQNVKLLLALLDLPRDTGRGERHDRAHQDQADIDAVHADVIADAQRLTQGSWSNELVAAPADGAIELPKHLYRQQRIEIKRGGQRDGADDDAIIARHATPAARPATASR